MIYHDAARRLSAEGRGGDTTLVHMSPREVKSLQDLAMAHGGSLTVNPSTGLPEAGFLSSILPMVAGAALMATGVGAPMAAMLVGGGTALATGDISKGISAGLGAYGGAGLGAGLMSAGQAAAASAIPAEAVHFSQTGAELAGSPFSTMGQGLSNIASSGAAGEAARSGFMSGVGGLGGLAKTGLAAAAPAMMAAPETPPVAAKTPTMNRFEYQARPVSPTPMPDVPGYGDLGRDFGRQQRYFDSRFVNTGRKFVPGDFGTTTPMPMADGGSVPDYEELSRGQDLGYQVQPQMRSQVYTPRDIPGAQAKFAYESTPLAVPSAGYVPGYGDQGQDFGQQQRYFTRQFRELTPPPAPVVDSGGDGGGYGYGGTDSGYMAKGGMSHLGDYSDGGRMLRGPGDGVSDSIPATIGGKQPARLADGEFVVPARIVSELGNGSSEAGARKLYAMMDRVQNARKKTVGKGRVAVNSKAEKMLPA